MTNDRKLYPYPDRNGEEVYDGDRLVGLQSRRVCVLRADGGAWRVDIGGHSRRFDPVIENDRLAVWALFKLRKSSEPVKPPSPEHAILRDAMAGFEARFSTRDLTRASPGFEGYRDETTDAMSRAWAEAVRWCVGRMQ